ncbi:MAG: polyribonucleotide nucleotidyltransferase, partial [Anaerolineae bacterium]|nr:polyribonucleotide nucleotidyltransferase [Anaerolineae bacterium]
EGRPSTEAILLCRLIDRPLRPLFPDGYHNDVQIVVTPLSADTEHHMDIISMIGASAALSISDIPFQGPIGAVRVGYLDGEYLIQPNVSQVAKSKLDLVLAGTEDSVLMIEVGADEVSEDVMLEAMRRGHAAIQEVIAMQKRMAASVGKAKREGVRSVIDPELVARVDELARERIEALVAASMERSERRKAEDQLVDQVLSELDETVDRDAAKEAYEAVFKKVMRRHILDTGIRVDGRDLDTIRDLHVEVGLLPRTHGSGLFSRGETQVLTTVTLGTASDEQEVEYLVGGKGARRYIHHYNFPPYSTGETYPIRGPRRRSIGHGALAERALECMIPPEEDFPYTIRAVSEVLSSNGSTSMASTCASTLALMDAGVPIKRPVAGIAMGVITEGNEWAVMTDIQGLEDHLGDMDFKVTGTAQGITAIQLDVKIGGLRWEIIEETLERARKARLQILDAMLAVIPEPRREISPYAPQIHTLHIPVDKIGALIGPGGKNIRGIIDDTGVTIDVDDDGTVRVGASDASSAREAIDRIEALTAEVKVGHIYTGKVVRTTDYGAFIEILPGQDGLCHISQLADYRVNKVEDIAEVGDELTVMVVDIDGQGRIRLSRKAVLQGWTAEEARENDRPPSRSSDNRRGRSHNRR